MANTESKRSIPSAQLGAGNSRKRKPRKTTLRALKFRSDSTRSHRFTDVRGKTVDFVEFYTTGGYHCLDVRFQDKTAITFSIEPGFTVEAEHANWETGDLSSLRRWPPEQSASL
jgi:hypothetical protein